MGYGITSALLNLINHELDIAKIYLNAKDLNEAKYQLLINKRESAGLNYLNDSRVFIEYSNDVDDIYKNDNCNPNKKRKILIVLDDILLICLVIKNVIQ